MSSITVFCPNARRQQVKIQPNTKVIDILEEVCKKQGYQSNEYELVYQKRSLDITLTYRLTGIPNNAQVELKKLETGPRQCDKVIVSLQLEDGSRLQPQEFKPDSTNLIDIIEHYLSLNISSNILKPALDEKLIEQTDNYPTISYLNEQVIGLYQLKNTTLKDLGLTSGRFILRFILRKIDKEQFESINKEFQLKLDKKFKLEEIYKKKQIQEEESSKLHTVNSTNSVIMEEQSLSPQQTVPPSISRSEQNTKRQKANEMDYEQTKYDSSVNLMQYEEIPNERKQNEYVSFKFPEETRGQNLNNLNELAEIERLSKESCDRLSLLFNLDEGKLESEQVSELKDEFFDVTVQDLRFMLSDLKRLQSEDAPLMTKQMRELEKDKKAMKYSKVVVRVVFKNRMALQGLFRPKELVSELYKFVKESLSENSSSEELDFYLFTTPPKTILKDMQKSLFDSDLCPASIVYFKNKCDIVPTFKSHINMRTVEEAEEIAFLHVHQAIREIKHEGLDWLAKEQIAVQNILKTNNLTSRQDNRGMVDYESSSNRDRTRQDDPVKNKLERFLKGSKK